MWMAAASLCLCAGIALGVFVHPAGQVAKDWTDGVRGLLMGLSIGMNLMVVWKARQGREELDLERPGAGSDSI